jgi:hypothetical protein
MAVNEMNLVQFAASRDLRCGAIESEGTNGLERREVSQMLEDVKFDRCAVGGIRTQEREHIVDSSSNRGRVDSLSFVAS